MDVMLPLPMEVKFLLSGRHQKKTLLKKKLSGESDEWDEDSEKSGDDQDSICMILVEEKMRHRDSELQTVPSSGTYNLDQREVYGGEELEEIAVSRKPFREPSCNLNVRTSLVQGVLGQ